MMVLDLVNTENSDIEYKKSKKGLLVVGTGGKMIPGGSTLICDDQCTWEEEQTGLLTTVFHNSKLIKTTTLQEIRTKLNNY